MTSYGGATNWLRSPVRERRYRIPANALTSAIGRAPELHIAEVGHARYLTQSRQHVGPDGIVDGEDHHRVAARSVAPDLHARDVDVVLAEDRAKTPDHARPVVVAADEEAPLRHEVDAKRVDSNRARLAHEHSAGELVPVHTKRDEAGVASTRGAAPFDQLDAPAGGDQSRVDGVDAVFRERLQHASNRGRDQKVDVVLGQLALALELDRVHPAAEHLAVQ